MKKLLSSTLILLGAMSSLFAQERSGKVSDGTSNAGLPGVNVIVQGITISTFTDASGMFKIAAASGNKLFFSFIGLTSVTQAVGSSNSINVHLFASNTELS